MDVTFIKGSGLAPSIGIGTNGPGAMYLIYYKKIILTSISLIALQTTN
jgi:hypothetical protein